MTLSPELTGLLERGRDGAGPVVVLTGAGISAESGIPTFRGADGYWQVGSRNYRSEELATYSAFSAMPEEVWSWYLYRRSVCLAARPNPAHEALVALEATLGDRFILVTQNVDGLHLRAGNSRERTYQIHGNIDTVRCARECGGPSGAFPGAIDTSWSKGRGLTRDEAAALHCSACGAWLRPHVLWFDECYDEERYRFESSLRAADTAALLLVVGTSGATNLPTQVCARADARGAPMVVVNVDPSPFTALAERSAVGWFARGEAGSQVPAIAAALGAEVA